MGVVDSQSSRYNLVATRVMTKKTSMGAKLLSPPVANCPDTISVPLPSV